MGVFQIESRAQMQSLVRTRPENLDDLTVQVALVRPGPIQGGAVHPYIERRKRLREDPSYKVPYLHPSLEPVLRDTLGAIVFQDQVLEVAMAFASFRPGEAEGLRRAMSRRRSEAAIRAYEEKFVAGGMASGATREVAERVWSQIVGFAGFGFPKAHSAAFGLLAYQSTWLRVHYGPEFLCALLNEQPMGFYPPDTLVHEAQRRGIEVLPPSVVASTAECRVEQGVSSLMHPYGAKGATPPDLAVRVGLGYVNGVREQEVRAMVEDGNGVGAGARWGPHQALGCVRRDARPARLGRGLRRAGRRRGRVAAPAGAVGGAGGGGARRPRCRRARSSPYRSSTPRAPELRALIRLGADARRLQVHRVTLREHPLELMRPGLPGDLRTTRSSSAIRTAAGCGGRAGGRAQRPATAKGVTFMLLEDTHGTVNLIDPAPVYERHRLAVRSEPLLLATGRLEHREGPWNVVVDRIERLEHPDLRRARDRPVEPRRSWSTETQEERRPAGGGAGSAQLRAARLTLSSRRRRAACAASPRAAGPRRRSTSRRPRTRLRCARRRRSRRRRPPRGRWLVAAAHVLAATSAVVVACVTQSSKSAHPADRHRVGDLEVAASSRVRRSRPCAALVVVGSLGDEGIEVQVGGDLAGGDAISDRQTASGSRVTSAAPRSQLSSAARAHSSSASRIASSGSPASIGRPHRAPIRRRIEERGPVEHVVRVDVGGLVGEDHAGALVVEDPHRARS